MLVPALHLSRGQAHAAACNPNRPGTPQDAFDTLLSGNARWSTQHQEHPGEDTDRRVCVAKNGQTPFAAILSCSDSRVPPELIFDQGLGDLFVARVAGNSASGKLIESLLFGTNNLGAPLIFVLGHSSCGAINAAVAAVRRRQQHPFEFVELIRPAVRTARHKVKQGGGDPDDDTKVIPLAVDENVILNVNRLRKKYQAQIKAGTLAVAGGRYDLSNQEVTILVGLAAG